MTPIQRLRHYRGLALFSYGFRPFFFLVAVYAAVAVGLWLLIWLGEITVPTVFAPRDWHVHEMLFGFIPAIATGFLLTAIPNWTGRLPLQGTPLIVLMTVWMAGRIAIAFSAYLGSVAAAAIDCGFLVLVALAGAREIIAGANWRNLKVLIPLAVLTLANIAFHWEAHVSGLADFSTRTGIAAILVLIMMIAGRIVPSFTHNWIARFNPGRLPKPFGKFDVVVIVSSVIALALWIASPSGVVTASMLMVAGLLQTLRLGRWAGDRTARERLVLILHLAYAFVPLGFVLTSLAAVSMIPASAGLHSWMVGAVGTMTLAIMTRASLGHTGRELVATLGTQMIYVAVILAALSRVLAAVFPAWTAVFLHVAACTWVGAFGGFAFLYAPLLFRPRRS